MGRGDDNFPTGDQAVAQTTEPRFNGGELLLAQAPSHIGWKTESAVHTANLVDAGFLPPMQIEPALTTATTDVVITLTENMAKLAWNAWNRNRAVESIQQVPEAEWSKAYTAFADLQRHLSEKDATKLMKAIVLNELEHADLLDWLQDACKRNGITLPFVKTFGLAQLSEIAISERISEYPNQLGQLKVQQEDALLNPAIAPHLVAATLSHYIRQFEKFNYPINIETLGYAYNPKLKKPDETADIMPSQTRLRQAEHTQNVMTWFDSF